jgi:hypothetical protein
MNTCGFRTFIRHALHESPRNQARGPVGPTRDRARASIGARTRAMTSVASEAQREDKLDELREAIMDMENVIEEGRIKIDAIIDGLTFDHGMSISAIKGAVPGVGRYSSINNRR